MISGSGEINKVAGQVSQDLKKKLSAAEKKAPRKQVIKPYIETKPAVQVQKPATHEEEQPKSDEKAKPEELKIIETPKIDEAETAEMKKARLEALEQMFSEIDQKGSSKRSNWEEEE